MAMASASAASALSNTARGSRHFTMALIWPLSPWPAPITVFFTAFGAYSAIESPSSAGTSKRDAPRLAELQRGRGVAVDEGVLDGRLLGRKPRQHLLQTIEDLPKPGTQAFPVVGDDRAAGDEDEPRPVACR